MTSKLLLTLKGFDKFCSILFDPKKAVYVRSRIQVGQALQKARFHESTGKIYPIVLANISYAYLRVGVFLSELTDLHFIAFLSLLTERDIFLHYYEMNTFLRVVRRLTQGIDVETKFLQMIASVVLNSNTSTIESILSEAVIQYVPKVSNFSYIALRSELVSFNLSSVSMKLPPEYQQLIKSADSNVRRIHKFRSLNWMHHLGFS